MSSRLDEIMDTNQAAAYMGVHPVTLRNWRLYYGLPCAKKGHSLIFLKSDLDAFTPPSKTHAHTKDGQHKHLRAVELYDRQGMTMKEIAAELGYKGESGASRAVQYGRAKLSRRKNKKAR